MLRKCSLLLVVALTSLALWAKDAYLVFPFSDATGENIGVEGKTAFTLALHLTGRGDIIPYYERSPIVSRLVKEGTLTEEDVTSAPSSDRALEIGKLLGANFVFLGSLENLQEEEGVIEITEKVEMWDVAKETLVKEAVVTGKSRSKVNGVSREIAIREALDEAGKMAVSALVGAAKPPEKPKEVRKAEKRSYYVLGALLLGWLAIRQSREKEGLTGVGAVQAVYDPSEEAVVLSWKKAKGDVASYQIYRASLTGSTGAPWNIGTVDVKSLTYEYLDEVSPQDLKYTDYAITFGEGYAYMVISVGVKGEKGEKAYSNFLVPGAMPAPQNVSARKIGNYVEITWDAVPGAASYRIYRSNSQTGVFTAVGSTANLIFMDQNPPTGDLWYKVATISPEGAEGFASSPVQARAEENPPPTP